MIGQDMQSGLGGAYLGGLSQQQAFYQSAQGVHSNQISIARQQAESLRYIGMIASVGIIGNTDKRSILEVDMQIDVDRIIFSINMKDEVDSLLSDWDK